jgi:hypothetical protein
MQTLPQAESGNRLTKSIGWLFRRAIGDEFDSLQQPPSADITNDLVARLQVQ